MTYMNEYRMDALLSTSIIGGFLSKSRYYFFGGLLVIFGHLIIMWIMFATASESNTQVISLNGNIFLAVMGYVMNTCLADIIAKC